MKNILIIFPFFIISCAVCQTLEFVRPVHDISNLLSIKQEQNLEHRLTKLFPLGALRRTCHGKDKLLSQRITYDVIRQHGRKYVLVIFTGSWKNEASQFAMFRLDGNSPSVVHRSFCWHSNFSDTYHEIQSLPFGKEHIILIKEGEMGKSPFALASVFSFREKPGDEDHPGYFYINDLTPRLPRLKVHAGFPFKALYAQAVKIEKDSDHITLQAADVEFSWNLDSGRGLNLWRYDKTSRKFLPEESLSAIN